MAYIHTYILTVHTVHTYIHSYNNSALNSYKYFFVRHTYIIGGTFCTKIYRSVDYNAIIWALQQVCIMYVCTYVCMYVCIYIYSNVEAVFVFTHACRYVCMYVCMYAFSSIVDTYLTTPKI